MGFPLQFTGENAKNSLNKYYTELFNFCFVRVYQITKRFFAGKEGHA